MRSTQLQTLRAVAAGADTSKALAAELNITSQCACQRISGLVRDGWIVASSPGRAVGAFPAAGATYSLTDRARALLETRARLDGETMP